MLMVKLYDAKISSNARSDVESSTCKRAHILVKHNGPYNIKQLLISTIYLI